MSSCGYSTICTGEESCCIDDHGRYYCCSNYSYYHKWWFWFMWVTVLLICVSCFIGCYRACRSRRSNGYIIVNPNQLPPLYGSVVVSSNTAHTAGNYVTCAGYVPSNTVPAAPPPYGAYPQEKPPEYSATQS